MVRINKVYTRSGDDGSTGLVGGDRVSKSSLRIDTYGTVDELNAVIGVVAVALRGSPAATTLAPIVARIQNELFNLGAELATRDAERRARSPQVSGADVSRLESEIDELNEELPELRSFVLPGGGAVSAHLHLARTVCRRAERLLVALAAEEPDTVSDAALHYLNRLSDALFVFGRHAAHAEGEDEPLWKPG
jgi:cob(I)alamin adenosyltransferase